MLEPVLEFCRFPRRAADLADVLPTARARRRPAPPRSSVKGDIALARKYLAEGGASELVRRARGRVARLRTPDPDRELDPTDTP